MLPEGQQGLNLLQEGRSLSGLPLAQLPVGLEQQAFRPAHLRETGGVRRSSRRPAGSDPGARLTSLRLSLSTGAARMSPRRPVASVHSSSTKAPTSRVKVPAFSFSSSSSCGSGGGQIRSGQQLMWTQWGLTSSQPAGGGQSPGPGPAPGRSFSAAARSGSGSLSGACRPPAPPPRWPERPACPSVGTETHLGLFTPLKILLGLNWGHVATTTRGALAEKGPNLGSYFVLPVSGHAVGPAPLLSEALQLQHAPGAAVGLEMGDLAQNRQRNSRRENTRRLYLLKDGVLGHLEMFWKRWKVRVISSINSVKHNKA